MIRRNALPSAGGSQTRLLAVSCPTNSASSFVPRVSSPRARSGKQAFPSGCSTIFETATGQASIATMHLAGALEFRAVLVTACDDKAIPLQERIETVGDEADLQEVYETERHLLYFACTRARNHLLVCGVAPVSEFLDDFEVV
ncbi:3'-5' exonuclease [Bradyrhizobium sp. SZCCHNS3016]|nr:3'-5' exonuclease [Bradyrhizobium sp. SZCCHNS3016]